MRGRKLRTFLGYEVSVLQEDTARDQTGRRLINGVIA
jgi:hypothetical protein